MTDNDLQRQAERRKILKGMIQKSFPDDEVTELTQEYAVWKIGISRDSNRIRCRIVVQASEPLMTDVNNHYEIVFNAAIKTLNNILNNPPLKNEYFQEHCIWIIYRQTRLWNGQSNFIREKNFNLSTSQLTV